MPLTRRQLLYTGFPAVLHAQSSRPNILWILAEDFGPQLQCYGYPIVNTPNLDQFGLEGARFARAFTTAPVCSASRSAFNTGVYQTTTGTHNHRSHRNNGYKLPAGVELITDRVRRQGYFTANILKVAEGVSGAGKTDFNFTASKPFDGTHWRERKPGQPFFAQINFRETHKGPAFVEARKQAKLVDPQSVPLPPYYADHPVIRDEMANYLDTVNLLDRKVGVLLNELKKDGLLEDTMIFFMGDNGRCLLRGKQWLYDAGIHVPMMLRWPGVVKPGTVREDPVLSLDMTATTLRAAGLPLPEMFDGRPLYGDKVRERGYIIAARDRCDMTVDRIRCVRDKQYKYIRNFMPERPYTQFNNYIETQYPTLNVIEKLHAEGKLNATQQLFMAPRKPEVELYDVVADPHEVNNLAGKPAHARSVKEYAQRLETWIKETGDRGSVPESQAEIDASLN
jgi:N-sulfoglucosamine sulfohydrolase